MQIRPLSYALGAEIIGVDIRQPLDDKSFTKIHSALLERCILLFRGQELTREHQIAFTRQFGEVEKNDAAVLRSNATLENRDPKHPELLVVRPKPNQNPTVGLVWHSDRAFTCTPTAVEMLRGVELPAVGGDTMFSNMYLAYEALSDGMKRLIDGLYGVHPGGTRLIDNSTPERLAETKRLQPAVAQPLVRVHPETGRKSLFIGEKVKQIVGMHAEESAPLLQFLCTHAARPRFVYRHQWQKDDLIVWDNRCTNHLAVCDYDKSQVRHLEKTAVAGSPSGYVYDGPLQ